jgi:hypothetical protein
VIMYGLKLPIAVKNIIFKASVPPYDKIEERALGRKTMSLSAGMQILSTCSLQCSLMQLKTSQSHL